MHSATYSPEDNKLRLYPARRLSKEEYDRVRAAGFIWAPKQELFVAPTWTPAREDLLVEMCGEIDDEDKTLVERAEERAERFEDYSDKRGAEADAARAAAGAIADRIPLGQPILVGHHSEKHARRDAERIQNGMRKAVSLWRTSKYWTERAKGAILHAKYKELPAVRARRIKTIEAEKRKAETSRQKAVVILGFWRKEGLTIERARAIANAHYLYLAKSDCGRFDWTAWDLLRHEENGLAPHWTPERVRDAAVVALETSIASSERWIEHCENRLAYERAMLAEAGGLPSDRTRPEVGGGCRCWASPGYGKGYSFIRKVNKVSVTVEDNWGNGGANFKRTIPFDKLKSLVSKADVDAARAAGTLHETADKTGFFLGEPAESRKESKDRIHREAVANTVAERDAAFERLAEVAKDGVNVVTAPQLFPTPPEVAARVVELADLHPGHTILEPSAGTGRLLAAIRADRPCAYLVAVEINAQLAAAPALTCYATKVICDDFLSLNGKLGAFDRIVMNPPFENGADIKHIRHALTHLREGGKLVAICANGPRQQAELMPEADTWIELEAGTFDGTDVMAAVAVFSK